MAPSAIFGQPPASEEDFLILKGFAISMGIPPDKIQRDKGIPVPVKPHGSNPYADHSTNMIAALSVAVALMIAITSLRIWLRLFRRDLKAGLDDLFIIIATVMCCVWIGLQIAMAKVGGGGKHLYAVTYQQFYWYFHVGHPSIPSCPLLKHQLTRMDGKAGRNWTDHFLAYSRPDQRIHHFVQSPPDRPHLQTVAIRTLHIFDTFGRLHHHVFLYESLHLPTCRY